MAAYNHFTTTTELYPGLKTVKPDWTGVDYDEIPADYEILRPGGPAFTFLVFVGTISGAQGGNWRDVFSLCPASPAGATPALFTGRGRSQIGAYKMTGSLVEDELSLTRDYHLWYLGLKSVCFMEKIEDELVAEV